MIFWVILFIFVILVSFLLAIRSMRDFHEIPQVLGTDYATFLIRKTVNVTSDFLNRLHSLMLKEGLLVSFERLFKGSESSLLIFAPRKIIQNFSEELDLIEIENYTNISPAQISGFEMGTRGSRATLENFFKDFPKLKETEAVWWQLNLKADKESMFVTLPRVIIVSNTALEISKELQHLAAGFLTKIPKPYTKEQILQFYKRRNFSQDSYTPSLTPSEVRHLIVLN